jgi:signal transduction histidine kinase
MSPELHPMVVLRLGITIVEVTFVVVVMFLARAPGWQALRALILSGVSAAVYSFAQLLFSTPGVSNQALLVVVRFASLAASVNAISWLWYISHDRRPPSSTRFEKALGALLLVLGGLSLIPGPLAVKGLVLRSFSFFQMDVVPGPFMALNSVIVVVAFTWVFAHYLADARRNVQGARATTVAFGIFFLLAVHECLIVIGVFDAPSVIGLGFLALIFARAGIVARRVSDDAALRLKLSLELETKVQERTTELVLVKDALMQKERLAALGQLAAGVGHEINNPLTYVLGNLEVLLTMDPPLSDDAREIVEEALDGAERVRQIVRDLRALGKGVGRDRVELVSLADAASGAHKLVAMQLRSKNVSVRIDADDSVARVDRGRLGQVLVNLLMNAAAALPASIDDPERRTVIVQVKRADTNAVIQVVDRGVGIKKDELARVFEPFYTTKTDSGGTGLGLYVCHSVVSSYGGTITMDSNEGEGSTVTITLPRAEGVAPEASGDLTLPVRKSTPTPVPVLKEGPAERVLLVDDDAPVARAMARLLPGYAVDVANDVGQAKVLLDKNVYSAVVCDLRMTGASGMVLFGHLRQTNPPLARRFMLVTGGGLSSEERAELDDYGAPILTKPVEGAELRMNVKKLTARS